MTLRVLDTREQILTLPDRFKAQWSKNWEHRFSREPSCKTTGEMYAELMTLDLNTVHPDRITEIIGNDSWHRFLCNECGTYHDTVIEMGMKPDYDSATAYICPACLQKAYDKMTSFMQQKQEVICCNDYVVYSDSRFKQNGRGFWCDELNEWVDFNHATRFKLHHREQLVIGSHQVENSDEEWRLVNEFDVCS